LRIVSSATRVIDNTGIRKRFLRGMRALLLANGAAGMYARAGRGGFMRMRDIAQSLGVSTMTVSRALRADASVAPATRRAVLEAVEALGYVPDQTAASLSSRRSGFVAILVPSLNNPHFSETVLGLSRQLDAAGLQLLIGDTNYDRLREEALVKAFLARKPEAVILTSDGHTDGTIRHLAAAKLPVVEIWDSPADPIQHVVGFSNRDAMRTLVATLASRGYRRIAYLGESGDDGTRGEARRQGYLDAVSAMGLGSPRVCRIAPPPATMSDGEAALAAVLAAYPDSDLLVCVSDPLAFGVVNACLRRGMKVPEDIAVAGFGDFEVGRISTPSLTTLTVDAAQLSKEIADVVLASLGETGPAETQPGIRAVPYAAAIRESAPGRTG
jgi:LacI family transcriptional regulator, gluconate utilization system Gnt-I transcriptional repressor